MAAACIQILLIICPGIISSYVYMKICKEKPDKLIFLVRFCRFALADFFLINLMLYVRGEKEFNWLFFSSGLIVKLSAAAIILSILMPVAAALCGKYIQVRIEIKETLNETAKEK